MAPWYPVAADGFRLAVMFPTSLGVVKLSRDNVGQALLFNERNGNSLVLLFVLLLVLLLVAVLVVLLVAVLVVVGKLVVEVVVASASAA